MANFRKERFTYKTWGNGYYHLSSDGWQEGKLFYNESQYSYGMLLIGILTLRFKITIYDFTLMDNHVHILLSGTGGECTNAFDYFRMKLTARLVKDGFPPLPVEYGFKLTPITNEEQMRVNFLYLDRNVLERGICLPGGYPWGAAYLHCSFLGEFLHGVPACEMSKNKLEKICGSRIPIPPHWEFHPQLGLLPKSFVDSSLFRRLFPSPKEYQTRLVKDYEAFVKLGRVMEDDLNFSKEELRDMANQLARDLFAGKRVQTLSHEEKAKLCVSLEGRYGLSPAQLATALSLSEYLVRQILSSKDYGRKHWNVP